MQTEDFKRTDFKSDEEYWFYLWALELREHGIIHGDILYEPQTYELTKKRDYKYTEQLKTKVKGRTGTLIASHKYTPDFYLKLTPTFRGVFFNDINFADNNTAPFYANSKGFEEDYYGVFEVKGERDANGSTSKTVLSMKFTYALHGEFVNLVKVHFKKNGLFHKTFTPKKLIPSCYKQKGGLYSKYMKPRTIEEYLNENKKTDISNQMDIFCNTTKQRKAKK